MIDFYFSLVLNGTRSPFDGNKAICIIFENVVWLSYSYLTKKKKEGLSSAFSLPQEAEDSFCLLPPTPTPLGLTTCPNDSPGNL